MTEQIEVDGAKAVLYRDAPDWDGARCLAVGEVKFPDAASGQALLERAAAVARDEGFDALLGPLDGDTWHGYRLVSKSDGQPPFLMEPTSGAHDLAAFEAAGFEPVSRYVSAIANLPNTLGDVPVTMDGVTVSPWDGQDVEVLIGALFDMSTGAFSRNRFYKPIGREAFEAIYRPLIPFIVPDHVLFARDDAGELIGFLFGTPNPMWSEGPRSCILKTYAATRRGVGHLLADTYHRRAIEMGFERVIHALMHRENASLDRSGQHGAEVFREYALMGRRLA